MITITRAHEICAGHRIHTHENKCSHLHGHNYRFELTCTAPRLDQVGRVIDFSVIKELLCDWLEENWDHRMLLFHRDPWLELLEGLDERVRAVTFIPTAENMAKYMVEEVGPRQFYGTRVTLIGCEVFETSKCSAYYSLDRVSEERDDASPSRSVETL